MRNIQLFADWLGSLQQRICQRLTDIDGKATFLQDDWQSKLGHGSTRVMTNGKVFEKAGVNFSWVSGEKLPHSANQLRPEFAGSAFEALGISLVVHPHNPHVPTSHMNIRMFNLPGKSPKWWFGGGYDLTPYYPYDADCRHWHQTAYHACKDFGDCLYHTYKKQCDAYFYLPHRGETRGIGGLFFDNLILDNFAQSLAFVQSIGNSYLDAYMPIVEKRMHTPWTDEQRAFLSYRRGRYVEFNLVYDRGTLFGLQSGGRTESILMSMPPHASWQYQHTSDHERHLVDNYLTPRDWITNTRQEKESLNNS